MRRASLRIKSCSVPSSSLLSLFTLEPASPQKFRGYTQHTCTHTHTHTNTHTTGNSENLVLTGVRSSVKEQSEVCDLLLLTRLAHSPDLSTFVHLGPYTDIHKHPTPQLLRLYEGFIKALLRQAYANIRRLLISLQGSPRPQASYPSTLFSISPPSNTEFYNSVFWSLTILVYLLDVVVLKVQFCRYRASEVCAACVMSLLRLRQLDAGIASASAAKSASAAAAKSGSLSDGGNLYLSKKHSSAFAPGDSHWSPHLSYYTCYRRKEVAHISDEVLASAVVDVSETVMR